MGGIFMTGALNCLRGHLDPGAAGYQAYISLLLSSFQFLTSSWLQAAHHMAFKDSFRICLRKRGLLQDKQMQKRSAVPLIRAVLMPRMHVLPGYLNGIVLVPAGDHMAGLPRH